MAIIRHQKLNNFKVISIVDSLSLDSTNLLNNTPSTLDSTLQNNSDVAPDSAAVLESDSSSIVAPDSVAVKKE